MAGGESRRTVCPVDSHREGSRNAAVGEKKAQSGKKPTRKLSIPFVSRTFSIFQRTFSYQILPKLGKVDTIIF